MNTKTRTLTLRVNEDLLNAIKKIASEQNRSVANFIETELIAIAKRDETFGMTPEMIERNKVLNF